MLGLQFIDAVTGEGIPGVGVKANSSTGCINENDGVTDDTGTVEIGPFRPGDDVTPDVVPPSDRPFDPIQIPPISIPNNPPLDGGVFKPPMPTITLNPTVST